MRYVHVLPFGLLFSAFATGQAPYQNISHHFWGPKAVFAGNSSWYAFVPMTAVPVTCDAANSRCSAPGYQFQGGETARFYSQGKAPTGLYTIWGGGEAIYGICDLQGTTFTLRQNNCSGSVVTFTDNGSGKQNVLVSLYGRNTYFTQVSGFPAGTVLNWSFLYPGGIALPLFTTNGIPYDLAGYNAALQVVIPSTAAPGMYKVSITAAQDALGNNASTLSWNISVNPPPRSRVTPPTYIPAIPGLSGWQTTMTSTNGGGHEWCANPANPTEVFGFGDFTQVWYYDGARVYFQIADYTHDPTWNNCGHNIASQYADYVIANNGTTWGYSVFPQGLAMASLRYPTETKFAQAFNMLLNTGIFTPLGGRPDDDVIRETAYAVEVFTVAESMLGYTPNSHPNLGNLQRSAEYLMGMLDSYTDGTSRYSMNQTYFDGLAMEALTDYYQLTQDARVPMVVKRMLDSIWANYDQINHVIVYNPDPDGPHCSDTPIWWGLGGGDCALHTIYGRILHNLIAGAFAWYWSISGDDTYRSEGDELFQHTLDILPFSGKEFSQAYRWSFYYVNTRTTGNRKGSWSGHQTVEYLSRPRYLTAISFRARRGDLSGTF
jgi:hypothetical protein